MDTIFKQCQNKSGDTSVDIDNTINFHVIVFRTPFMFRYARNTSTFRSLRAMQTFSLASKSICVKNYEYFKYFISHLTALITSINRYTD